MHYLLWMTFKVFKSTGNVLCDMSFCWNFWLVLFFSPLIFSLGSHVLRKKTAEIKCHFHPITSRIYSVAWHHCWCWLWGQLTVRLRQWLSGFTTVKLFSPHPFPYFTLWNYYVSHWRSGSLHSISLRAEQVLYLLMFFLSPSYNTCPTGDADFHCLKECPVELLSHLGSH